MTRHSKAEQTVKRPNRLLVFVAVAACMLLVLAPVIARAALPSAEYGWYTSGAGTQDNPYEISNVGQWLGFANLVNGTADVDADESTPAEQDSFDGKYVVLTADLAFRGELIEPVGGGAYDTSFNGSFDGGGHTARAFAISTVLSGVDAQGATEYIGLFGKTGPDSSIANLNADDASVTVSVLNGDGTAKEQAIRYVGILAGYCGGSISGCTTGGTVSVTNEMNQTADVTLPIQWVGGMAGAVEGDLSGCSGSATVNVSEPGNPDPDLDQATIVFGVGGLAGCVGSPDSSVDADTARNQADISACSFSGNLNIDTPSENGTDRFGNQIYALACTAGGIAGYTRGNVSDCTNSGTFVAPHTTAMGGIVGSLRGQFAGSNFVGEGSDDGMADGASEIVLSNCYNTGSMQGWANVGGVVGRSGTNTVVTGSFNGLTSDGEIVHNYVLGGRSTKPYPAGIASSCYGKVTYCANFGEVSSIANNQPVDLATGTYTTGGGYYASGIVGILQYYTDSDGNRTQGMSEVYGCYNAGPVRANSLMRQRALIGDNEGYVHDCLAVAGLVENDDMFYTESDNGTYANCAVVTAAQLKQNAEIEVDGETTYPAVLLNAMADADGWNDYWTLSQYGLNEGYPVTDNQVTWDSTDIASAQVTLAANAEYTGDASVPKATVVLDGVTLMQNVDFRVQPQDDAIEITPEGEAPYKGYIIGIGSYSGVATTPLSYGIDKGNLANCSVLVDPTDFNWEGQLPSADDVHVTNPVGGTVSPDEYTFALDPDDSKLIDGQAVNAGSYTLVVTAKDDSEHFYGNVNGTYTIAKVRIVGSSDGSDDDSAVVKGITYLGDAYPWQSTGNNSTTPTDDENLLEFEYTGHSIKPAVTEVTYLGRPLVEGRDFRVVYGAATMDGDVDDTPNTEVGDGWIIVRFVAGSNFTNYDLMHFKIVESTGKHDITKAQVNCPAEVVYEPGDAGYEPVTVSYGGSLLEEGTDYSIVYENNNALGTASYVITGMDDYEGELSGTFELVEGEAFTILYEYDSPAVGQATMLGVEYNGIRDTFDLVIPETVEHDGVTYTVTAIADKACGGITYLDFTLTDANMSKHKVASVQIPATVQTIGANAFGSTASGYNMVNLKEVTFADGSQLMTIGEKAFASTAITEIVIPANVETIGDAAFKDTSITKVTFLTTDADKPVMTSTNTAVNTFRGVKNVEAYGYASAATAKNYVTTMNGYSGYTWTWNEMEEPISVMYGDANSDGKVTARDALLALRYSTGKAGDDVVNFAAAEVSGDGKVTARDALLILRYSTGKIDKFPVEE